MVLSDLDPCSRLDSLLRNNVKLPQALSWQRLLARLTGIPVETLPSVVIWSINTSHQGVRRLSLSCMRRGCAIKLLFDLQCRPGFKQAKPLKTEVEDSAEF